MDAPPPAGRMAESRLADRGGLCRVSPQVGLPRGPRTIGPPRGLAIPLVAARQLVVTPFARFLRPAAVTRASPATRQSRRGSPAGRLCRGCHYRPCSAANRTAAPYRTAPAPPAATRYGRGVMGLTMIAQAPSTAPASAAGRMTRWRRECTVLSFVVDWAGATADREGARSRRRACARRGPDLALSSGRTLAALFGRLPSGVGERARPIERAQPSTRGWFSRPAAGPYRRNQGGPQRRHRPWTAGAVRVGHSKQGREGRVPCAVSDLLGVSAADDGTTGGAHRGAVAQQVGRGTGR